ncbi:DDB1- and CUL4-associated factor 5 [Portunus trituberculatus]|uniref:DDB1-and CUL4-associated factor 5 n=1 Tax=Portunus trituberculatus TaxID=210409 RepID=A0A5B7EDP2_PORTR|nr:DDB1- and CUL4-associated factor 5 [Portunus trituberculatus]
MHRSGSYEMDTVLCFSITVGLRILGQICCPRNATSGNPCDPEGRNRTPSDVMSMLLGSDIQENDENEDSDFFIETEESEDSSSDFDSDIGDRDFHKPPHVLPSRNVLDVNHDYSHGSMDEDPRMMAFFDSLVQREVEGWTSNTDLSDDLDDNAPGSGLDDDDTETTTTTTQSSLPHLYKRAYIKCSDAVNFDVAMFEIRGASLSVKATADIMVHDTSSSCNI